MEIFPISTIKSSSHPVTMKLDMIKFRVSFIEIKVSFCAFALLTFSVIISGKDSLIPVCVISSMIHETAHLYYIIKFSGKPRSITFGAEGLTIETESFNYTPMQELLITASGVVCNFVLFLIFRIVYICHPAELLYNFSMCNLCLGIFNVLPLRSLDGGQLLLLFLSRKFDLYISEIILNVVSFIVVIPVAVVGFMVLFASRYNYSLLIVAIYLIMVITSKEMR